MADKPEVESPESDDQEGGPVKSFLEHLEDLRWVLIKSGAAAGVAVLICLLAGNYVVQILEWPLKRAKHWTTLPAKSATLVFGTNRLANFQVSTNDILAPFVGTNQHVRLVIKPVLMGTNTLLTLESQPEPPTSRQLPVEIVNLSPAGSFVVAMKVALYAGLVLAAPFIFYFVADFVFPALRMRERKYVYSGLAFGAGLFALGISFCYFVLMPLALSASVQYAEWLGFAANQWRAEDYISFVCRFMLGMGIGFQLPVVILTLVKIGVLNYRILSGARRYVIVIVFILGAILTTPEVITQVAMAIPLWFLYEITVVIAWYWERQERKRIQTT